MINLMISYSLLFLWGFSTLRTIIASSNCPSRDVYIPTPPTPVDDAIRRGTPTELWAYPFVVSLIEQHSVTKLFRHLCGGVIVNMGVVMTTCSCAGVATKGGTFVHERCRSLIVLAGTPDIYMNNSNHKQVFTTNTQKFETKLGELTQLGTVCNQPGWVSDTIYYGVQPNVPGWIAEARNKLIKRRKCREMHCIFEDQGPACRHGFVGGFCATSYQGDPSMLSDIGGPLVCHGWVFGITSIPSCEACSPTVYVGPSIWLEFIKDLIPGNTAFGGATFSRMRSSTGTLLCTFLIAMYLNVRL